MADFDITQPVRGFLDDPLGSLKNYADSGNRLPQTSTKTTHGLTIHATVGNRRGVIGAIHKLSRREGREIDEEYENDALSDGIPIDLVPQTLSTRTLSIERYELYRAPMRQVFGAGAGLVMLCDQRGPLSLRFTWKEPGPSSVVGSVLSNRVEQLNVIEFIDAWFVDCGEEYSADGNRIVNVGATLKWRRIRRLN